LMLRRTMNARIGKTGLPASLAAKLWASATVAAAAGWGVKVVLPPVHPIVAAVAILGVYGVVYFTGTFVMNVPEAGRAISGLRRRLPG